MSIHWKFYTLILLRLLSSNELTSEFSWITSQVTFRELWFKILDWARNLKVMYEVAMLLLLHAYLYFFHHLCRSLLFIEACWACWRLTPGINVLLNKGDDLNCCQSIVICKSTLYLWYWFYHRIELKISPSEGNIHSFICSNVIASRTSTAFCKLMTIL